MNTEGRGRIRIWVNWMLALLTVPGAAFVMFFALGSAMSTDECSSRPCANIGPNMAAYNVMLYGAPAVALAAIIVSFVTAPRSRGIVVPLCAAALLAADVAALAIAFRH